jgi:hypothetical protein
MIGNVLYSLPFNKTVSGFHEINHTKVCGESSSPQTGDLPKDDDQ